MANPVTKTVSAPLPRPAVPIRWLAVAGGVLALLAALFVGLQRHDTPGGGKASLDVQVWKGGKIERDGKPLGVAALPLEPDDILTFQVKPDRPSYVYLIWVNGAGEAVPVYPWKGYSWDKRPPTETKHREPLTVSDRWQLDFGGATGLVTVVMLMRDEPLPPTIDLHKVIGRLPPVPSPSPHTLAWFRNWSLITNDLERRPNLGENEDSQLIQLRQDLLKERLGKYGRSSLCVTFAFAAK